MHKKYHEKFKILDILAVTTQAHKGIETPDSLLFRHTFRVTTQAHKGIETSLSMLESFTIGVTTQAHKGIETCLRCRLFYSSRRNNSSP